VFGGFGVWGQVLQKVAIFATKGTFLRETTSFKPKLFCVKIGRGVWPPSRLGKKSESHRDSHGKDMSPSTQGLNYRSACEVGFRPKIVQNTLQRTLHPKVGNY